MTKFQVNNDKDRQAFRVFAELHPLEASEVNWPEFVAFAKEKNPEITADTIREAIRILK